MDHLLSFQRQVRVARAPRDVATVTVLAEPFARSRYANRRSIPSRLQVCHTSNIGAFLSPPFLSEYNAILRFFDDIIVKSQTPCDA